MSIISEGVVTPNRIRSIYQWLLTCDNYQEEEGKLKRFLIPTPFNTTGEDKKDRHQIIINPILNECEEMGLINRENGYVSLSEEVINSIKEKNTSFSLIISDLIFLKNNKRNEDFATSIAWTLAIDPFNAPSDWKEFEPKIKQSGCDIITGMTNSVPYSNFTIWSTFLGFSWRYQRFVPDPTEHLGWRISHHFQNGDVITVNEFLLKLRELIPVLDGGIYRNLIQEKLGEKLEESSVSVSLSLALLRLQDEGIIKLEKKSDTHSRVLAKDLGAISFSHIIIL